jgi:hypothetical protein
LNDSIRWMHEIRTHGVVSCRLGREGASLVAEWPGLARLTSDDGGARPVLTPMPGAAPSALEKLQGMVNALTVDLRGGLGLHAAAVSLDSRAVLFLGESGAGKSTAAAQMCLQCGAEFLADDAAPVEKRDGVVQVLPSEVQHYLTTSSADALRIHVARRAKDAPPKEPLPARRCASGPSPLALIVHLRFDQTAGALTRHRLGGAQAAQRVLAGMYRFDVVNRAGELDRIAAMLAQAPFVELTRPRSEPDVAAAVLRELRELR